MAEYNVSAIHLNPWEFSVCFFKKLSLLSVENTSHRDAQLPENIHKNRHHQIIPCKIFLNDKNIKIFSSHTDDHNRVCLSRILGHPYINASLIEVRIDFLFTYLFNYHK